MDKSAIRNFAIEARKILMKSAITEAGFYGITKEGCKSPIQKGQDFEVYETLAGTENRIFGSDMKRRANLVRAIEEQGFDQVVEETAYTWFNRIIAIRFMEVNDYLPTRVRVLSSETGSNTPDIVTQSLDVDLNMTPDELEKVQQAKDNNKYDEAFRLLFIKQCNELNDILPGLFEKTDDYMELLLKLSYTGDGVVRMLVDTVPEDSFNVETEGQVEIIGWMYQYYNTELKDDTFAKLKKNVKISKERIPAATQLFTPDWIVRYMVENSVGRVWIEHLRAVDPSVDEKAKAKEFDWEYYLPEAEQEESVNDQLVEIRKSYKDLTPMDITCIDPCMGSGHVLVYIFDVLMDIYRSEGYNERDSVFDILERNIHGLDIDRRAYQLSYFALKMKARGYNRTFFRGKTDKNNDRIQIEPMVFSVEESNEINRDHLKVLGASLDDTMKQEAFLQINELLDSFINAREYGSIIKTGLYDWKLLIEFIKNDKSENQISFYTLGIDATKQKLARLVKLAQIITNKYWSVVTNPPYRGIGDVEVALQEYVKKEYPYSYSDLSTVFMESCFRQLHENGVVSMINIPVWMSLASYKELRKELLTSSTIINMLHLGRGMFGSDYGTTAFSYCKKSMPHYKGFYKKFFVKAVSVESEEKKKELFFEGTKDYQTDQSLFLDLPNEFIAYWATQSFVDAFNNGKNIGSYATVFEGLKTRDKDRFLRLWFEISDDKWKPYAKGGSFRRWYGNNDYVVKWGENGDEVRNFKKSSGANFNHYFSPSITYTAMTMSKFSGRYIDEHIFGGGGGGITNSQELFYLLGFVNSKPYDLIISAMKSTVNFEVGQIGSIPLIIDEQNKDRIIALVKENIELSKEEWDSYEYSWDFKCHPLIQKNKTISASFFEWKTKAEYRFQQVKNNEIELNELFIGIYGMENELDKDVEDNDVTMRKADLKSDIKSLISYAVGCMFGRYSLDYEGLICNNRYLDSSKYKTYIPEKDNILYITDEEYYSDDIVGKFILWLETVYGKDNLEENLNFIANSLGNNKESSRKVIRDYFVNEFFQDHAKIYSTNGSGKKPIYWLLDGGKQNGFKALIYMHRYNQDTMGLVRSDYLIKVQDAIESAYKNSEYIIANTTNAVDKARATKARAKYVKQMSEIKLYFQALSHIALQRIELDLDDGIKVNYAKFQGVEVSNEGIKKQTIDLLAKI